MLGLTGGVGMGKSTAATLLTKRGVTIVDTDVLARQLVESGQPALVEIRDTFGDEMLAVDGSLRRDLLARRVFSDPAARRTLESILHPRIRQLWLSKLNEWRSTFAGTLCQKTPPSPLQSGGKERLDFFCVVIPLLFETGAESEVDATVCLGCSADTQHERLISRGWNAEQIRQRIHSQLPIAEKMARADYVIWNEGSVEILGDQLDRMLRSVSRLR